MINNTLIEIDNILNNTIVDSFAFNLSHLPNHNNFETDIRQDEVFRNFFINIDKKTHHCLYWFSTTNNKSAILLNYKLDSERKILKINKRVVPAKNENEKSNVLYVGVRRGGLTKKYNLSNISGRIIQHLGYYYKGSTQGLQLIHWCKNENIKISINIIEFKNLPNEYLYIIEKLYALNLKPLCGKH